MPKEDTQFKPGQSGNPAGRPKDSGRIRHILAAIEKVEKQRKRQKKRGMSASLYEHYVKTAFEDKTVLMHLMGRLVPSLKSVNAHIDADATGNITISWLTPEPRPEGVPDIDENIRSLNRK